MLMRDCFGTDEVFTHIDPDTEEVRHFNASAVARAMPQLLREGKAVLITAAMDPDFVDFVKRRRGVNMVKALSMMGTDVLDTPVIGVALPDDFVLTIDGHHRLTGLAAAGKTEYDMYVVALEAWPQFLVTDLPGEFSDFLVQDTLADAASRG